MDKNDLIPVHISVYYQQEDSPPTYCYGTWSRTSKLPTHYMVEKELWEDRYNAVERENALGRDIDRLLVQNKKLADRKTDLATELAHVRWRRMQEVDEIWGVLMKWRMEMDYGSHSDTTVHATVFCVLTNLLKEVFQVEGCPVCLGTTKVIRNNEERLCLNCRHCGYPHGWVYIISEEEDDEEEG